MWISDESIEHMRDVMDRPDLTGTRYELVERIARGGMGTVYTARDRDLGRLIALKVLNAPLPTRDDVQRILTEAQIIARLEHPGIVPVHDVGALPDGRIFYVMKLVRGKQLDEFFLDDSPIPVRLRLFERICETVAFAHAHGVIHRDLKPQNIMVGSFGEVLVLDWGVAKVTKGNAPNAGNGQSEEQSIQSVRVCVKPDTERTQTLRTAKGTVIGTPAYMSPEQARGEIDRVDERSDVYALGAILYQLLTFKTPQESSESRQASAEVDSTPQLQPPRRINPAVSKSLDAVCMKALAAEPQDRYDSAQSLAQDILNILNALPTSAYRETWLDWPRRVFTKYRAAVILVVTYLFFRLLFIFWTTD